MDSATILCVDDEPAIGVVLEDAISRLGHRALLARSVEEAMAILHRQPVDLVISDYRMPGATGLDLLDLIKQAGYETPVVMLTAYGSIQHAVESIKKGAIDYLTKPITPEALDIAVTQALELVRLRRENAEFRREMQQLRGRRQIVGASPALRRVLDMVAAVAPSRATVLLEGESGTGKELLARAIHEQSPRRDRPFVTLNCAAMPEGLVESALFGHERGAFTGATGRALGAFERAHGGTLLLDEISEMRLDLQAKLLRVIQEQQFERLGGQTTVSVDVRLIATTNRDLKAAVARGEFRDDLYWRLCVVPIRTPPLRERLEDIPLLVRHFARLAALDSGIPTPDVAPEAIALLQRHSWPGNVRELANVVERAVILFRGRRIGPEAFASVLSTATQVAPAATVEPSSSPAPAAPAASGPIPAGLYDLREIERIMIEQALQATGGNRVRAAKLLGISERTLRNKLNASPAAS
jgi:DNA-binding NtrC family response regulator